MISALFVAAVIGTRDDLMRPSVLQCERTEKNTAPNDTRTTEPATMDTLLVLNGPAKLPLALASGVAAHDPLKHVTVKARDTKPQLCC